jgi:hypothetical protein
MGATILMAGALLFLLGSAILGSFLAGDPGRRLDPAAAIAIGIGIGIVVMLLVRWARGFADRVVFRERATPYEVLSEFSGRVGETYSLEDVLPRMAVLLAKGTGASVARIGSTWMGSSARSLPSPTTRRSTDSSHATVTSSGPTIRPRTPSLSDTRASCSEPWPSRCPRTTR